MSSEVTFYALTNNIFRSSTLKYIVVVGMLEELFIFTFFKRSYCLLGLCYLNYVAYPPQCLITFVCAREVDIPPLDWKCQYAVLRVSVWERDRIPFFNIASSCSLHHSVVRLSWSCKYFYFVWDSYDDGKLVWLCYLYPALTVKLFKLECSDFII